MLIIKKKHLLCLVALSYLNTFVFSSFVYAANQQVDTSKSPTTFMSATKQIMAMIAGGVFGTMCLVGMLILLNRRLFDKRISKTRGCKLNCVNP
jgi:hypothetical protein